MQLIVINPAVGPECYDQQALGLPAPDRYGSPGSMQDTSSLFDANYYQTGLATFRRKIEDSGTRQSEDCGLVTS